MIFNTQPILLQKDLQKPHHSVWLLFCSVLSIALLWLPEGELEESLDLKADIQFEHSSRDIETDEDKDR